MEVNRKYLVAVALLAVLAVVFGFAGASAPMSEPVSTEQSSSSSDSVTHFVNPPTYESGWINITDKCGQHVTLVHNLSTTDITVDITGRTANLTEENWHQFWSMGDVDEDGYVTETDVDLIVDHFSSSDPQYDINEDGTVDVLDINICLGNIGKDIWTYFGAEIHQRHLGGTGYMPGWSRTYGGTDTDEAYSVVQTLDGGYAIAGKTWSFDVGWGDFWLVKTDASGVMQWNKTYGDGAGNDYAYSVVQTLDGGYAIAGWTNSFDVAPGDCYLVKTDSAGNMVWNKTYGGADNDEAYSLVQTGDGGYALAGFTTSFDVAVRDFYLVKTDSDGVMLWNKTYGGADYDYAYSLVQTRDGGYAIAGSTRSFGPGTYENYWLVKTDSAGNMVWNKTYGWGGSDVAYSVVQTLDGGYAIAGWTDSVFLIGGFENFWLVKTDSAGNMVWNKTYGGRFNYAQSVVQTLDGGYALAGFTYYSGASEEDFWLVKSDVEMGLAWTGSTANTTTLYRGKTDPYWNYMRVRIWTIKEPTWQFGDINQDGIVDAKDLAIIGRNYGKTFSALSLGGIAAIAGIYTYKKHKRPK